MVINRTERFAYINLALLLFMSVKPYPRWFLPSGLYQVFFLCSTALSLLMLNPIIEKGEFKIRMLLLILFYAIFFNLPIVHEFRPGYFFDSLIFIEIILVPTSVFLNAYGLLRKIFYWISFFSILIWILHTIGLELPHYTYWGTDFRENRFDNYHIYGPVISMYHGQGFTAHLERVCGVFGEPGHFGILIGLMLAINRFRFNTREDIVMLLAGILTFSTAFYGLLGLGLVYQLLQGRKGVNNFQKILPVFMIATLALIQSRDIKEVIVGRVVEGRQVNNVNDLIENRVLDTTKSHYEKLLHSNGIWFGKGLTDTNVVQETNWRGGVYRYGIVGVAVFVLLILNIVSIAPLKYRLLLLSMVALVMSHRIYQLFYTGIPYLIYAASLINSEQVIYINEEEDNSMEIA